MTRRSFGILSTLGAVLVLYALFYAQLGFFIVDEVVYLAAADAFRDTGGFAIENGFDQFHSPDLTWTSILAVGPEGLTSQYPPGTAVFWAWLMSAFGDRAIIVSKAFAMTGALFATFAMSKTLFRSERLALGAAVLFLFGTFSAEYAFVLWPHATSVMTVVTAFWLFLLAMEPDRAPFGLAVLSGLVLGVGMLFRIDNVLLLPAIAVIAILWARRPFAIIAGGAVGLLPAFAALSFVNHAKFGTWNPVSYGSHGGYTDAADYIWFGVFILVALAALYGMRSLRSFRVPPRLLVLAALVVAAAVFLMPQLGSLAGSFLHGFMSLVVDARLIDDPYNGEVKMNDGTVLFWGLSKKALGQSMPWLGLLLFVASPRFREGHGRALAIVGLVVAFWSFPFLLRGWHGGMSLNMRYFLPLMPFLATLGAFVLARLARFGDCRASVAAAAGVIGVGVAFLWVLRAPSGLAGAHQILSLWVLLAVSAAALAAVISSSPSVAQSAFLVAGVAVGVAVFNSASDTVISQLRRHGGAALTDLSESLPDKVLLYGALLRSAIDDPRQIVAAPHQGSKGPDETLIRQAMGQGYRVLMPPEMAYEFVASHPAYRMGAPVSGPVRFVEIVSG